MKWFVGSGGFTKFAPPAKVYNASTRHYCSAKKSGTDPTE